jgi:hypothetical protein
MVAPLGTMPSFTSSSVSGPTAPQRVALEPEAPPAQGAHPGSSPMFVDGFECARAVPLSLDGASGAGGLDAAKAETAVQKRTDETVPMKLYGTTRAERGATLPRLTQIDGDAKTVNDDQTCGVQCVVAGLYLQRPEALPQVAKTLAALPPEKLDAVARNAGLDPAKARATLKGISGGTASPAQLSQLSQLLLSHAKMDNPNLPAGRGVNADVLRHLTEEVLVKQCGVDVPPMHLNLMKVDGENHWIANFPQASQADTVEGAKVDHHLTFDPWPDAQGRSPVGIAMTQDGADQQQARSATHLQSVTVAPGGKLTAGSLESP